MRSKLSAVIDGTGGNKLAPSPHRGLIKALYETVDACGGANMGQIKKYLPAAIDNFSQVATTKKIEKSLYSAVYRGYLVHSPTNDYWKIAPLSYYKERQRIMQQLKDNPTSHTGIRERLKLEVDQTRFFTHEQWHTIIAITTVAFILGFAVGMAVQIVL